jgi:hypothetical protein
MSQDFGMQVPSRHATAERPRPVKFLVLIDSGDGKIARLYSDTYALLNACDASAPEITAMTTGLAPGRGAIGQAWDPALQAFSVQDRLTAEVFTLGGR